MPKATMSAGKEFETLSKAELDASLKEWMIEAIKGIRPVAIMSQGTADATGSVVLGGATSVTGGTLGPREGYWWAVQRLAVRVDGVPAPYSVYRNTVAAGDLVRDVPGENYGYASFGPWELMLVGGESLVIQSNSLTASTGVLTVAGQAVEIPNGLLWKWMAG